MKYNMKGGLSFGGVSLDPSAIATTVTKTLLKDGSPLAEAAKVATSLPGKLTKVVTDVKAAPDLIAQAAADKATEAIEAKLAEAPAPAANNGSGKATANNAGNNTGEENTGEENTGEENTGEENTGEENTGEEENEENTGEENTGEENAPEEEEEEEEEEENENAGEEENEEEEENENNQEGGRYKMIRLKKRLKDPLHVFYLNGKPIYYTDNGKGRVKILPIHMNMKMAKTSSRHKYTKKVRRKRKTRSTKKSRAKGVRKRSRKAKQRRTRKR